MQSFFRLVGFEYKKLFIRKSTVFSLFLIAVIFILLNIASVTGNGYWHSNYLFEILGFVFTPAVFYIVLSIAISILAVPMVKYFFKNHEVV